MARAYHLFDRRLFGLLGLAGILLSGPASAQAPDASFPSRPIKIISASPAGGGVDLSARIIADQLQKLWGQPVTVENRTGGSNNIAGEAVAKAEPDGYTLLATPPGTITANAVLFKHLNYDPAALEPVAIMAVAPNVLSVKSSSPAKTVTDLIAHAKASPGKISYASQGNGSTSHLSAMLFQKLTGTEMVHVPYRGTAPALQDIMGNHIDLFFDNLGSSLNLHNAGNLRILALGSPQRVPSLPDIPTLAEAGVDQFQSVTWFAVVAPPGTPAAITQSLNQVIGEVLQQASVREQFEKIGVRALGGSVVETKRFIAEERERWADVIRTTNVRIE